MNQRQLRVCSSLVVIAGAVFLNNSGSMFAQEVFRSNAPQEVDGFDSAEAAAIEMVRAIATRDHRLYVKTRLLGVCEGQDDWPSRYAECLHTTLFTTGDQAITVFDMKNMLDDDKIRVVLQTELEVPSSYLVSSYYGEQFASVNLQIATSKGVDYETRIVVAKNSGRWFAIPRRTKCSFYALEHGSPAEVGVK